MGLERRPKYREVRTWVRHHRSPSPPPQSKTSQRVGTTQNQHRKQCVTGYSVEKGVSVGFISTRKGPGPKLEKECSQSFRDLRYAHGIFLERKASPSKEGTHATSALLLTPPLTLHPTRRNMLRPAASANVELRLRRLSAEDRATGAAASDLVPRSALISATDSALCPSNILRNLVRLRRTMHWRRLTAWPHAGLHASKFGRRAGLGRAALITLLANCGCCIPIGEAAQDILVEHFRIDLGLLSRELCKHPIYILDLHRIVYLVEAHEKATPRRTPLWRDVLGNNPAFRGRRRSVRTWHVSQIGLGMSLFAHRSRVVKKRRVHDHVKGLCPSKGA